MTLKPPRLAQSPSRFAWLFAALVAGLWVAVVWSASHALDRFAASVQAPSGVASSKTGYAKALSAQASESITMPPSTEGAWPICEGPNRAARRVTCVVDGDTFWLFGQRHRLACIDTPELDASDPAQRFHAIRAQIHLARMLADPGARLVPTGRRDFFERHLSSIDLVGLRGQARTLEADMVAFGLAEWTDYRSTRDHCRLRRERGGVQ